MAADSDCSFVSMGHTTRGGQGTAVAFRPARDMRHGERARYTRSFGLGGTSGYWRRFSTLAINLLLKGRVSCHGARRVLWQEKKNEC